MKTIFTIILLSVAGSNVFSQGLALPYFTGFDTPAQKAGWTQYRTGFHSTNQWNNSGALSHDYNVGGSATDTVVDWYVSPALNFTSTGQVSMKVMTGGFSNPIPDNCEIWYVTSNPNPATGNFVLIANLSYMQPKYVWLDTIINIPFSGINSYLAFKYKTIGAAWMTYSIDSITVSISTGITDNSSSNDAATIFPNPFNSMTTIQFITPVDNAELNFFNLYGQKIKTINNISGNKFNLNKEELATGVYVVQLTQNDKIISRNKVIITD